LTKNEVFGKWSTVVAQLIERSIICSNPAAAWQGQEMAEIERKKNFYRKRGSSKAADSGDERSEQPDTNRRTNPGRDFKIPKKRNSGPEVAPEPSGSSSNPVGANSFSSPKIEQVQIL
jgi:hypothetical protein